jgi:hypothetical protein
MNWHLVATGDDLKGAKITVEHAEGEDDTVGPDPAIVKATRRIAATLAQHLGGDVHVELHGHETLAGRGFRPAHVSLSVSRRAPAADHPRTT